MWSWGCWMDDRGFLREPDGKGSSSRVALMVGAVIYGMIFIVWLVTVAGFWFDAWDWSRFADAMTWGAGFASVTFVPYLVNKFVQRKNRSQK